MSQELDLLTQLHSSVKDIQSDVTTIKTIVTGNGTPEKGLIMSHAHLVDSVKHCQQLAVDWRKKHDEDSQLSNKNKIVLGCCIISSITAIVVAFLK